VVTSWALLCAPLAVSVGAVLAAEQRPLATLAGGAALVTLWGHWYAPAEGALVVLAFLFARDVGALDRGMPLRQTFTLAGVGTLAVITALGLGFDLAMSLGGYPEGEYVLFGVYLDDPATWKA
jgi:hypothetical protein